MMSQSVDIPDMITSGKNPHPPAVQTQCLWVAANQNTVYLKEGGLKHLFSDTGWFEKLHRSQNHEYKNYSELC